MYINDEGYLCIQRPEMEYIRGDNGIAIAMGEVLKQRKYKVNKEGLFEEVKENECGHDIETQYGHNEQKYCKECNK